MSYKVCYDIIRLLFGSDNLNTHAVRWTKGRQENAVTRTFFFPFDCCLHQSKQTVAYWNSCQRDGPAVII